MAASARPGCRRAAGKSNEAAAKPPEAGVVARGDVASARQAHQARAGALTGRCGSIATCCTKAPSLGPVKVSPRARCCPGSSWPRTGGATLSLSMAYLPAWPVPGRSAMPWRSLAKRRRVHQRLRRRRRRWWPERRPPTTTRRRPVARQALCGAYRARDDSACCAPPASRACRSSELPPRARWLAAIEPDVVGTEAPRAGK